jgi:hypothetical protein
MDEDTLTQNKQMANVAVMSDEPRRAKVKPIMIYPQTGEQRKLFKAAADRENRKLSPFIVHVVQEYLRQQEMTQTPEGRLEEARRRMIQRTA